MKHTEFRDRKMENYEEFVFSPNSAIDTEIRDLLANFSSESQQRMRKAILNAKKAVEKHHDENTDAGARHIFREFIPASIFNQHGFAFEYEDPINGKKPDWTDTTQKLMMESYTYERGGYSSFFDRENSSIRTKCQKYAEIIKLYSFHFIVAVYLDFLAGMTLEECHEDAEMFRTVFETNDSLYTILFFTETQVIVNFQKRAQNPLLLAAGFDKVDVPIPWLNNKLLQIIFG